MHYELISKSIKETHSVAEKLLQKLSGNLICLYGELGSGKTTFVQGLAKVLEVKKRILSPTFVLIRQYTISQYSILNTQFSILIHIDCYRLNSEKDLKSVDLKEFWSDPKNLVVIEWAEKITNILPKKRIEVKFTYVSENQRKIEVKN